MAEAARSQGKIICFRCRRALRTACPRCHRASLAPAGPRLPPMRLTRVGLGLWLAGAALVGSVVGAALSLLR